MPNFTREEILSQLDDCAHGYEFPMLDNGYNYPADVRLSAYRDEMRWAIIIEDLNCHNRAYQHDAFSHCAYCFGNCLKGSPGLGKDFTSSTSDSPNESIFVDGDDSVEENGSAIVRSDLKEILIRDQIVPVDLTPENLLAKGIALEEAPIIHDYELLRSLLPENRDLLLATEEELHQHVPSDLPLLLRLDEWHHPDLSGDELPSESETFQMIADVLVTGNINRYSPTKAPNTHWSNWPEGGTL